MRLLVEDHLPDRGPRLEVRTDAGRPFATFLQTPVLLGARWLMVDAQGRPQLRVEASGSGLGPTFRIHREGHPTADLVQPFLAVRPEFHLTWGGQPQRRAVGDFAGYKYRVTRGEDWSATVSKPGSTSPADHWLHLEEGEDPTLILAMTVAINLAQPQPVVEDLDGLL